MPLPNTRKLATTFIYQGMAFKLSPLMSKMEALEETVGMDYFTFIDCITGMGEFKGQKPRTDLLSVLFFHLQDNPETYTRDEIHEWLFADVKSMGSEKVQTDLLAVLLALKGIDYQDMISAATAEKKEAEVPLTAD